MIAIRGLAIAAILGTAAVALAPRAAAEPARETFSLEFRYQATRTALDNYLAFARQIERACMVSGVRGVQARKRDTACIDEMLDRLVQHMDRAELADIHANRLGRRDDSSRTLAAR